MNFADFQHFRGNLLRERTGVLDCAATNLYATLARLVPPAGAAPKGTVHRCHLAAEWAEGFGFSIEDSRRALVSCGVRDSLALLFRYFATGGARLWLPTDNYPVYGELARMAGLSWQEFATLPEPAWPRDEPGAAIEIMVVSNPLKPLGRWLTEGDVTALTAWLNAHPRRRLFIDAVYTFGTRLHATTLQLLTTGQAILLHSLTKGWLHPRLFGVALVPERDVADLAPVFRVQSPPQANLARARELMAGHAEMPTAIAHELDVARKRLLSAIPQGLTDLTHTDAPGYFVPVAGQWRDILDRAKVLGLPASAFGSRCKDITILSSLSFLT